MVSRIKVSVSFRVTVKFFAIAVYVVFVILRLAVVIEHRLATDRQTDGPIHDDSICHTSIASRG